MFSKFFGAHNSVPVQQSKLSFSARPKSSAAVKKEEDKADEGEAERSAGATLNSDAENGTFSTVTRLASSSY